jgi:hypothetical protein
VFGWTPCPEWGEVELPHLQLGDAVVFDTGGMGLNYVVTNFYLKNLFGRNDAIFANLGFTAGGKERFAEAYGSKNTRAIFPEFPNLESLTHFVNEIHNLCANPDQLKVALEKYNMESTSIPTVTDPNVPVSSNMVNIVVEEIETPKVKKPRKFKVGDFVRHEEGWDGIVVEVDKKDQNVPYKCYCYYSGSCRWSAPKSLTLVKKVRKDKKLGEV